ncbi:TrmH family RNA methyltransferase [Candidatus Falkowbacteria bacterium]|jgi:23S rRNA (guanosine2251-2'-O)-methyltransferase|nr:TrmH family RNA methyltransferase [Candidatus Falkowbacteria bacterium]MBT5503390.1 TrmH family RNA methyltransferase [Candidatus Falkowbacteria bacterium]MBT6574047.1 TrmH family RNA methyltransferase [Candidatus Falkowbacteria bacterium]MBT7348616.1 TrmH family RNA methyltransferase [Candidatus Falkowbacteria bacterium]MBT7500407.1 TrmH family RNA methyltransferase [Candidatus Falkowbacteria bacterium]
MQKPSIIVIANKIRSLYNVGSIFRTCDAIGAEKLYLAGYTASPNEKPIQLAKTALGADLTVPWEKIKTLAPTIKKYKSLGYEIIGLEEVKNKSLDYRKWQPKNKVVIILGNEVTGIPSNIQKQCDKIISLPMLGIKKSLNVTVALGGLLYYILATK